MTSSNPFTLLNEKNAEALVGGGQARIEKQHQKGRLTARERIAVLVDPNSFVELDRLVTHNSTNTDIKPYLGDGVVTGHATIHGRQICLFAQDFTVHGGSLSGAHADKISKVMDLAMKIGVPLIGINDSGGARIQEGVQSLSGYSRLFAKNVMASGVIPQISAIMGSCAGGSVYSPAITDFIFMIDNTSQMFITGPDVIKTVMHEEVTKEDLGGSKIHTQQSGVAHFRLPDELACIDHIKTLLSFLPSNNTEDPPRKDTKNTKNTPLTELDTLIPQDPIKPYDMMDLITPIVDDGFFFPIAKEFATNIIVGFTRFEGRPVGIVANQPNALAGCLDINASSKAARFVRFCDAFNMPVVTLVDVPGYLPGTAQEHQGIIRHGAKLLFAYAEATVPKITIVTRKAYGGAWDVMGSKDLGADLNFAFPMAEIAVMGSEGAVNIIYRKELAALTDESEREKKRQQLTENYRQQFATPYQAAERGYIDQVIFPRDTRQHIIESLRILENKRDKLPAKKHANIPL